MAKFSYDIETLTILEDLLESQDAWVIQMLEQNGHGHESLDRHIIHETFLKDAYSSLMLRAHMLAYSDITIGTLTNAHANPIVI